MPASQSGFQKVSPTISVGAPRGHCCVCHCGREKLECIKEKRRKRLPNGESGEKRKKRGKNSPRGKAFVPDTRGTKTSQVQAGLITEAERENSKIKDGDGRAPTRTCTVLFTAKKVSRPTKARERIIKNMSSRMQQKPLFRIGGPATAVQSEKGAGEGERNASMCAEHKSHPRKWGRRGRGGVEDRGNKKRRARRMAEGRMAWDAERKNESGREMRRGGGRKRRGFQMAEPYSRDSSRWTFPSKKRSPPRSARR